MHSNSSKYLLNLEEVYIKKVVHEDKFVKIYVSTKPKGHIYPRCKAGTTKIHDYCEQVIKDRPNQTKDTLLCLRKRRYVCPCG